MKLLRIIMLIFRLNRMYKYRQTLNQNKWDKHNYKKQIPIQKGQIKMKKAIKTNSQNKNYNNNNNSRNSNKLMSTKWRNR